MANTLNETALRELLSLHPHPPETKFAYGTAGFRYHNSILDSVFLRMGIFAAIRSASFSHHHPQGAVGLMITASHNSECDNGIKVADPHGGMLDANWEKYAVEIVNAPTTDECMRVILRLLRDYCCGDNNNMNNFNICVHIGRDTRSHSEKFRNLATLGACAISSSCVIDHGIVTTPMLHYFVMNANTHLMPNLIQQRFGDEHDVYIETLCQSFLALIGTIGSGANNKKRSRRNGEKVLMVDCACGVGGPKIAALNERLQGIISAANNAYLDKNNPEIISATKLKVVNNVNDGPLNEQCGAEHVQKNQLPPKIFSTSSSFINNNQSSMPSSPRWCSLDGDADRIVFHYTSPVDGKFNLLDGDKIAVLVALFIHDELMELDKVLLSGRGASGGVGDTGGVASMKKLRCGVVQTAYANGSSTAYLRDICKIHVSIAKTGVKHVHHTAESNYDVGIYFEPNGHGTVLLGPSFHSYMSHAEQALRSNNINAATKQRAVLAWKRLIVLPSLVNQAVGDALSDLLLVEGIIQIKEEEGWANIIGEDAISDFELWNGLYQDMPSRQCKVRVKDRSVIVMNHNETKAEQPQSLQQALDSEMMTFANAAAAAQPSGGNGNASLAKPRCFVRPSGTEDVVRVYAEAGTKKEADDLAERAAVLVHMLCGGVGDPPNDLFGRRQSNL